MSKMMFQDTMDDSRVVQPIHAEGKHQVCKVFFREGERLVPAGTTSLLTRLFNFEGSDPADLHRNQRYGFVPVG